MPNTPTVGLPYPVPTDPADVPADIEALAMKLDGLPALHGLLPGSRLDYAEVATTLTVTATTEAAAQAYITGHPVACDGATVLRIEAYVPTVDHAATAASQGIFLYLYEDAVSLGMVAGFSNPTASVDVLWPLAAVARYRTPAGGSHTYSLRAYKTGGAAALVAGPGGPGQRVPAYLEVTAAGRAGSTTRPGPDVDEPEAAPKRRKR